MHGSNLADIRLQRKNPNKHKKLRDESNKFVFTVQQRKHMQEQCKFLSEYTKIIEADKKVVEADVKVFVKRHKQKKQLLKKEQKKREHWDSPWRTMREEMMCKNHMDKASYHSGYLDRKKVIILFNHRTQLLKLWCI